MTLADATIRSTVQIIGINASADGRSSRLEDLGFLAGTTVRVDRKAALGDPTIYELRGTRIALRKADAALIVVSQIFEAAE
jgi:ferrous iron transport protein A